MYFDTSNEDFDEELDEEDEELEEDEEDEEEPRSWDDYGDCKFAVESEGWTILAFDDGFQQEVFEKYLEYTGLTEENIAQLIENGYDIDKVDNLPDNVDCFIQYEFEALGIEGDEEDVYLSSIVGEYGRKTYELIEQLGWDCDFEGDSWKLETSGVYFIE